MSPSEERLPSHLKKYVVSQHYERYTPEEQATWRYLLRQLKNFLSQAAHPCYSEGLEKTGISIERIPKISAMDHLLKTFGWGAVPVSGFIPPAAFMEFQSLGILPIACDMRSLDHFLYTPAPDIVHEAAGHAPILIHPEYAEYLKSYAQVARKSIISKEDLNQYEAIRKLSDLKEHPNSTPQEIESAEVLLNEINKNMSYVSEASLLSRMNWWTAEYGLIGSVHSPKIYGAGLLSSLGESRDCLKDHVKKIPLDVSCIEVSYDITEPQPQLFVTPDFSHLHVVLEDLAKRLAYRKGGIFGLKEAVRAKSVNTLELDSGLQISGVLEDFKQNDSGVFFIRFSGPCQLSSNNLELPGHGKNFHSHGYSSPIGPLRDLQKPLHRLSEEEAHRLGLIKNNKVVLNFQSGVRLNGTFISEIKNERGEFLLLSFTDCSVKLGEEVLFDPSWGQYDLACGFEIPSVFGGPSDREAYGEIEDFVAEKVPLKTPSPQQTSLYDFYRTVADLRKSPPSAIELTEIWSKYLSLSDKTWLLGLEIVEVAELLNLNELRDRFSTELKSIFKNFSSNIEDGISLIEKI